MKINIVDWKPSTDLRTVSQRIDRLEEFGMHLNEGEGALFSNVAQDRFRVVTKMGGILVLLIPPVNCKTVEDKCSLYLKISLWLRKTFNVDDFLKEALDEDIKFSEYRVMKYY